MIAEIYAFECGQLTMPFAIFFENADDGTMRAPIPSFLIKHPKGTVLFDTGLNEVIKTDPVGYMGERLAGITEVHFSDGEEIASRLETVDIDIERIDFVVNSHLHFDHTGGLAAILGLRFQTTARDSLTIYGPPGTREMVEGLLASMVPGHSLIELHSTYF